MGMVEIFYGKLIYSLRSPKKKKNLRETERKKKKPAVYILLSIFFFFRFRFARSIHSRRRNTETFPSESKRNGSLLMHSVERYTAIGQQTNNNQCSL